jgi:dethiobiotin synthetase
MYLDILKALKLNAVVVADAGLGTINHTVLTVSYLKQNSVKVKGVILNNFDNSSVMHSDNLQMIEEISGTNVIATLGKGDKNLNLRYQKMEDYFDEC